MHVVEEAHLPEAENSPMLRVSEGARMGGPE